MNIDRNIRKYLTQKNMSVSKLIQKSRIHKSLIFRILNGETQNPRILTVIKIAEALDVTVDDLITDECNEELDDLSDKKERM